MATFVLGKEETGSCERRLATLPQPISRVRSPRPILSLLSIQASSSQQTITGLLQHMVSNNGFTLHITPEKSRGSIAAFQSRHLDSLAWCSSHCVCHREVLGRSVILSKAIEALTHSTEGRYEWTMKQCQLSTVIINSTDGKIARVVNATNDGSVLQTRLIVKCHTKASCKGRPCWERVPFLR